MADCSYARCVQERRAIKKELQRWTKNMIFIVGLERIAEEFMGRRKWKHYQETILRSKPQAFVEPENKDWEEEDDKCCFCDGGMFLGQATSPPSDCSGSSSNSRSSFRESPLTDLPASSPPTATMATLDSVSSLASISSLASVTGYVKHSQVATTALPGLPMFPLSSQQQTPAVLFPPWYLSTSGPTPPDMKVESDTPPAVISLPASSAASTEQPLDLSAKAKEEALNSSRSPTPQSLRLAGLSVDSKNILKAKPRMSAVAGRRTYTEEELQAALRDIQSGKLGTRRAAVIYGIPRSTLRNKVYKLAMERERDAHLVVPVVEDKELSGAEEEKEVERTLRRPLLSVDDLMRVSMLDGDALRSLLEEAAMGRGGEVGESPVFSRTNELWQGLEHNALGPYISQLLAAGGVNSELSRTEGGDGVAKIPFPLLPELVRRMMTDEQHHLAKFSSGGRQDVVLNGISNSESKKSSDKEVTEMAARLAASTSQVKAAKLVGRAAESEECTDTETAASTSRVATPPNVILKIPSYKPTTKNGVATPGCESVPSGEGLFQNVGGPAFPGQESSQVFSSGSESQSPPITNFVGKGIAVSLRDVIAKSISQKFQQQGDLPLSQKLLSSSDEPPLKRGRLTPPIGASLSPSVIKQNNNNNSNVDDRNKTTGSTCSGKTGANSAATSGKGTRPKRGKYRNYDRDSLVEAVRAVQRGEMSVHRAGSYYGVPHSTLEYKVKERHLMRPRKREPKQQHTDDSKLKDEPGNSTRNASVPITVNDKLKVLHKPPKAPFTPTTPLPGAPNGLKITPPLFDPSLSPLAAYTGVPPPFPFWASPFHALPVPDFGASASGSFPANPEHFFASQMMHKLQEESRSVQRTRSPPLAVPALGKTAREMAESLYDGTGTNGNFLDGIIRSSLEMGLPSSSPKEGSTGVGNSGKMSNKALIDQLCRNSCLTPLPKADVTSNPKSSGTSVSNSDEESGKQECAGIKNSESDVILPPAVDLSQSFSGPECENQLVSNQDVSVAKDMDGETATEQNIHVALSDEDSKLCEESSSVHNLHAINTVDESACDSKTVSNRTGDIEAAKDLLPTEEGNENIGVKLETKLKMDNSQRD